MNRAARGDMSETKSKSKSKKGRGSGFLIVLLMAAGIVLIAYPMSSDWWNQLHQSRAIAAYRQTVSGTDTAEVDAMWEKAVKFNEELLSFPDRYHMTDDETAEYEDTLDVSGTGIMGYVEIDSVGIYLPIYHGTSEGVLQIAVGHLQGSSFPVGGASTHSVLTGHTGLPSGKLFTDIDQLKEGDTFKLIVLNRTLTYEVDQIHVVLPDEVEDLAIEEGKDYCTLVTCTPYGINTHRLLVRGHRIGEIEVTDDTENEAPAVDPALKYDILIVLPFLGGGALFVIVISLIVKRRKARKKREGRQKH